MKLDEMHPHTLTDSYKNSYCDFCEYTSGTKSKSCTECKFEVCYSCVEIINFREENKNIHIHNLNPISKLSGWTCDVCENSFTCEKYSWCCTECDYDCCVNCYYS